MSKFYVGQKVRDHVMKPGKDGIVISTSDTNEALSVLVDWGDRETLRYYSDGKYLPEWVPTLVDADEEWYIVHKPAVRFERWERVLVRDSRNEVWQAEFYLNRSDDNDYPYEGYRCSWKYCRKWDENLVGKVTED